MRDEEKIQDESGQYKLEYIKKLPLRTITLYGRQMECRVDEERDLVFPVKPDGSLTTTAMAGVISRKTKATQEAEPEETVQDNSAKIDEGSQEPVDEKGSNEKAEETEAEEDDPDGWRLRIYFTIIIASVILAIIIGARMIRKIRSRDIAATVPETTSTTVQSIESPIEEDPEATSATETLTTVLVAGNTILPGQQLDEDALSCIQITETRYWDMTATGGIYTENDIDRVSGLYATAYIPQGAYIRYSDVGVAYTVLNPWAQSSQQSVAIPVVATAETLRSLLVGNKVDLTIGIETKVSSEPDPTETTAETEKKTGVEHNSSVVESMLLDTYVIRGVCITDALNKDGESIFPAYYGYSMVPAAFMESEIRNSYEDSIDELLPMEIVVELTADQASALKALDLEGAEVTVTNAVAVVKNEIQSETYSQLQNVVTIIETILAEVAE